MITFKEPNVSLTICYRALDVNVKTIPSQCPSYLYKILTACSDGNNVLTIDAIPRLEGAAIGTDATNVSEDICTVIKLIRRCGGIEVWRE